MNGTWLPRYILICVFSSVNLMNVVDSSVLLHVLVQGSLSIAASIHTESPGKQWRSFMQGVFILSHRVRRNSTLKSKCPVQYKFYIESAWFNLVGQNGVTTTLRISCPLFSCIWLDYFNCWTLLLIHYYLQNCMIAYCILDMDDCHKELLL